MQVYDIQNGHFVLSDWGEKQSKQQKRDEILDRYRSSSWESMYDEDKLAVLQDTENMIAEEHGRAPCVVRPTSNDEVYGFCDSSQGYIAVNLSNCQNPYEALDTLVHEDNHIQQDYNFEHGTGYDAAAMGIMKSEKSYYQSNGNAYDAQNLEMDSNNAAASYLIGEEERYADDPAYADYIQSRGNHYQNVVDLYDEQGEACREGTREQLETTHDHNRYAEEPISDDEYESAKQSLDEGKSPCLDETRNVNGQLSDMSERHGWNQSQDQSQDQGMTMDEAADEGSGWKNDEKAGIDMSKSIGEDTAEKENIGQGSSEKEEQDKEQDEEQQEEQQEGVSL